MHPSPPVPLMRGSSNGTLMEVDRRQSLKSLPSHSTSSLLESSPSRLSMQGQQPHPLQRKRSQSRSRMRKDIDQSNNENHSHPGVVNMGMTLMVTATTWGHNDGRVSPGRASPKQPRTSLSVDTSHSKSHGGQPTPGAAARAAARHARQLSLVRSLVASGLEYDSDEESNTPELLPEPLSLFRRMFCCCCPGAPEDENDTKPRKMPSSSAPPSYSVSTLPISAPMKSPPTPLRTPITPVKITQQLQQITSSTSTTIQQSSSGTTTTTDSTLSPPSMTTSTSTLQPATPIVLRESPLMRAINAGNRTPRERPKQTSVSTNSVAQATVTFEEPAFQVPASIDEHPAESPIIMNEKGTIIDPASFAAATSDSGTGTPTPQPVNYQDFGSIRRVDSESIVGRSAISPNSNLQLVSSPDTPTRQVRLPLRVEQLLHDQQRRLSEQEASPLPRKSFATSLTQYDITASYDSQPASPMLRTTTTTTVIHTTFSLSAEPPSNPTTPLPPLSTTAALPPPTPAAAIPSPLVPTLLPLEQRINAPTPNRESLFEPEPVTMSEDLDLESVNARPPPVPATFNAPMTVSNMDGVDDDSVSDSRTHDSDHKTYQLHIGGGGGGSGQRFFTPSSHGRALSTISMRGTTTTQQPGNDLDSYHHQSSHSQSMDRVVPFNFPPDLSSNLTPALGVSGTPTATTPGRSTPISNGFAGIMPSPSITIR